jgi:hypothetical protein
MEGGRYSYYIGESEKAGRPNKLNFAQLANILQNIFAKRQSFWQS